MSTPMDGKCGSMTSAGRCSSSSSSSSSSSFCASLCSTFGVGFSFSLVFGVFFDPSGRPRFLGTVGDELARVLGLGGALFVGDNDTVDLLPRARRSTRLAEGE